MSATVTLTAVDHLATELQAVEGITTATADPSQVRTPGVWISHQGITFDRLGGPTHKLQLHLVVGDSGYLRSRDALVELLNDVLTVLDPDEDPYFRGLQLPTGHVLPGLVVPFNLPDDYRYQPEE